MKPQLVDTHCHLYLEEFDNDREAMMQRAENEGIFKFYLPAISSETTGALLASESAFPGRCFDMMGLHPCSVKANYRQELTLVEDWLANRKFAAVGEIGLDYFWDRSFDKEQILAFRYQAELAIHFKLPIVIHSRESMDDCIKMVNSFPGGSLTGIFHCFTGDYSMAERIIDTGFYLGIGGVLTYKNSGLAETIKSIPLEHIVLETDSPYLAPVPFRGKRNESSYLIYVARKLAEIKNISLEEVASVTTANAEKIFGG